MGTTRRCLSAPELARALVPEAVRLAGALGIAGRVRGNEFVAASRAQGGIGDSFAIVLKGPKAGRFFHNAAGIGGDLLALIRYMRGGDWRDAIEYARRFLGEDFVSAREPLRQPAPSGEEASATAKRAKAEKVWAGRQALAGTLGERYLRAVRGLAAVPLPETLGFAPHCWHELERRSFPAIIARVENDAGACLGLWRIYLDRATGRKAAIEHPHLGLGPVAGGAVRLSAATGARQDLGEGVETSLSVLQRFPDLDMRAALSTSGMRLFRWRAGVSEIVIWADRDAEDRREFLVFTRPDGRTVRRRNPMYGMRPGALAADALAKRAQAAGLGVAVVSPGIDGTDFNDLWREAS